MIAAKHKINPVPKADACGFGVDCPAGFATFVSGLTPRGVLRYGVNIFLAAALAIFTVCVFAPSARAVTTDTIGVLPAYPDPKVQYSDSWLIYKLDLGEVKEDAVQIINNKDQTAVVKVYAVDATTTSDGAFALVPEDAPLKDVGGWVRLAAGEIEVPARSKKLVPFQISIPKNADVGDHMGGIVIQEVQSEDQLQGSGVKIITRVGVRIYETVPGEVNKTYDLTRFDWRMAPSGQNNLLKDLLDLNKKTVFYIGLKNEGNVKLTPLANITLKNMFGQTVADLKNREIGVLFPHQENSESMVIWDKIPLLGRYTATLTTGFVEPGVAPKTQQLVIWVFPYRLVFIIALLLILIFLGRLILKYMREVSKEKMPIYTVQPHDTIGKIADQFRLKWKKLAKLNDLKKPYDVHAGQKLFIPQNKMNVQIINELKLRGWLVPSLVEQSGKISRKRGKVFFIAGIIIIIAAAGLYWIRLREKARMTQEIKLPETTPPAQETPDKTASGAFKKSSVKVEVVTPNGGSTDSSSRLVKKLELIGYSVTGSKTSQIGYDKTTIEYLPGKEGQAEMLKNDLGINEPVELKENNSLSVDAVVYNFAKPDMFLQF